MMSRDEPGHTFGHTIFIMSSLDISAFGHTTGHTFLVMSMSSGHTTGHYIYKYILCPHCRAYIPHWTWGRWGTPHMFQFRMIRRQRLTREKKKEKFYNLK